MVLLCRRVQASVAAGSTESKADMEVGSDLQRATLLIPLLCDLATWKVHQFITRSGATALV
jgi:hypothetical protein